MDRNHNNARVLLMLIMAAVVMLVIGCSSDRTPTGPNTQTSSVSGTEFQYPELTPEFLEHCLPAGYKLAPSMETLDACDTVRASHFSQWDHQATINIDHFIEFTYFPGMMNRDTTISIVAPNGCVPVADFYPHPTQFSGYVRMKFKIHEMGYDRVVNPATLVPMYYNENTGLCEPLTYQWEGNYQCIIVWTNHFSRYIITQRIN